MALQAQITCQLLVTLRNGHGWTRVIPGGSRDSKENNIIIGANEHYINLGVY